MLSNIAILMFPSKGNITPKSYLNQCVFSFLSMSLSIVWDLETHKILSLMIEILTNMHLGCPNFLGLRLDHFINETKILMCWLTCDNFTRSEFSGKFMQ